MTESTKTSSLSEISALITRIGGAIRPHVGMVAVNSTWRGVCADARKTLSL